MDDYDLRVVLHGTDTRLLFRGRVEEGRRLVEDRPNQDRMIGSWNRARKPTDEDDDFFPRFPLPLTHATT
jgi:hypothetical protein